jgi:hypothetical protein
MKGEIMTSSLEDSFVPPLSNQAGGLNNPVQGKKVKHVLEGGQTIDTVSSALSSETKKIETLSASLIKDLQARTSELPPPERVVLERAIGELQALQQLEKPLSESSPQTAQIHNKQPQNTPPQEADPYAKSKEDVRDIQQELAGTSFSTDLGIINQKLEEFTKELSSPKITDERREQIQKCIKELAQQIRSIPHRTEPETWAPRSFS